MAISEFEKLCFALQLGAAHAATFGNAAQPSLAQPDAAMGRSVDQAMQALLKGGSADAAQSAGLILDWQAFVQLDRHAQLDIMHTAIFGWPLDHLSPTAELMAAPSLQAATHKLMGLDRTRNFTKETVPLWPADKWVCVDYFDLRIWVNLFDSYIARGILHGNWENEEVGFVLDNLDAGDTMIDVGANVGVYTLQAAGAVGPEGCIHAFEPQTDTFAALSRSVTDNGFEGRCVLHNFALGDKDVDATIWRHHDNNPGASIIATEGSVPAGAGTATMLRRLDSMVFDRRVKLLKMDIEGYEPLLLTGGAKFFREHRPIILTEWFPRSMQQVAGSSSERYFEQLTGLGYTIRHLDGREPGQVLTFAMLADYDEINEPFNIACMPTQG